MKNFIKLKTEQILKRWGLYKKSPFQVYHLSRSDDYFTHIEFPKYGRTWLRYMVCQAIASKYQLPLKNMIFDICYPNLSLPRLYFVHGMRPEKNFQEYSYKPFLNKVRRPKGVIFQIRHPERVMESYYYQCLFRQKNTEINDNFKKFLRDPNFGIKKYAEYIDYYIPKIKETKHLIIKYENMVKNPEKILKTVLDFIEINLEEKEIKKIVQNSTKEKMREIEKNKVYNIGWLKPAQKNNFNSYKIRTLDKGSASELLDKEDKKFIKEICRECQHLKKYYPDLA